MRTKRATDRARRVLRGARAGSVLACALAGACAEPQPRSFAEFMEDRMAMEGTLARCNQDREGTLNDIECANARRAAATLALRIEQERRAELERESERKLAELRAEIERRERSEREALAAAEAARQAAYEAQWRVEGADGLDAPATAAAPLEDAAELDVSRGFGAPVPHDPAPTFGGIAPASIGAAPAAGPAAPESIGAAPAAGPAAPVVANTAPSTGADAAPRGDAQMPRPFREPAGL